MEQLTMAKVVLSMVRMVRMVRKVRMVSILAYVERASFRMSIRSLSRSGKRMPWYYR